MNDPVTTANRPGFSLDKTNAKFLGVCAGLARSLAIDPLWIRVGLVASVLAGFGLPILLYFIVAFIAD